MALGEPILPFRKGREGVIEATHIRTTAICSAILVLRAHSLYERYVAALDPRFLKRDEVTPEILERERDIYRAQAKATGKPDAVVEKIVTGKMEKFYEENCLYEQHFIRDEGMTVKELVDQAIAKLGENIAIRRYARFKVGESDGTLPPAAAVQVEEPVGQ